MSKRTALKGRRLMWCPKCERYAYPEPGNVCPTCGIQSDTIRCTRCGKQWKPRTGCVPGPDQCPFCHSGYYDRAKQEKTQQQPTAKIITQE